MRENRSIVDGDTMKEHCTPPLQTLTTNNNVPKLSNLQAKGLHQRVTRLHTSPWLHLGEIKENRIAI